MKRRAKKGAPISQADAFHRHQRAIEEKDEAMPEAMRAMLSPQEERAVAKSFNKLYGHPRGFEDRAKLILERHFELAAVAAEVELRPLIIEAFRDLRKVLPVAAVEEAMGMTLIKYDGKLRDVSDFEVRNDIYEEHPGHITPEVEEKLEAFRSLLCLIGGYEGRWCLYERLTKEDCK